MSVLRRGERGKRSNGNGNDYNGRHLIELHSVIKTYKTAAGDFTALDNINLTVGTGEFVAVIGKSGSGKSTLINMITGIDRPTSGEVYVAGAPIHTYNEGRMARWRGRSLGIVFQFFQLLPTLTVAENIMLPMDFCNMYSPRERRERALYLLDLVDVAEQADKLPTALSGGQQQRVAIARSLANDPPIVVADEPTGNLDSRTSEQVFALFEKLVAEGKTILMVTHDDDQAKRVRRTVIIHDGEIVNQYLATALPSLGQELLLKATKQAETLSFAPGAPIIYQDDRPDRFYVITQGEVNVYLRHPDGHETFVETLGPGQYFGEMALLRGTLRTATVRAARTSRVEVLALDKAAFTALMDGSEATRAVMQQVVSERRDVQTRVINGESR